MLSLIDMKDSAFTELIVFGTLESIDKGSYLLPFLINKESHIFEGHFPNQPIMPGVVMIEIIKRATELTVNAKIEMVSAGNFKFLKMLDPNEHKNAVLHFILTEMDDSWKVKAWLKIENEIYFKADANYKPR